MEWRALGDSAWLCELDGTAAHDLLRKTYALRTRLEQERIPEVTDIVPCYQSVAVHFDPRDGGRVDQWLRQYDSIPTGEPQDIREIIEVPVDYHDAGSELQHVAQALRMPLDEVISRHSSPTYEVAAVGFSPGFPYLSGLDPALAIPRKRTPSIVAAGSVAVAGGQAGIYPCASPGGWHVLGRTDLRLFDPHRALPSLLRPGDRIRFTASSSVGPLPEVAQAAKQGKDILVREAGMHTTIQDSGRPGYRAIGVSAGGTMDRVAAHVANRLVGNPPGTAVLECAGYGPVLEFHAACTVAWIGWIHGSGRPQPFQPGDVLDLRKNMNFSRGTIALAGGISAPSVLGSRSTDVRARLGGFRGRKLRNGDVLSASGPAGITPPRGNWHVGWPQPRGNLDIRFITGLQSDWFDSIEHHTFRTSIYQTTPASDRTGMRLHGPPIPYPADRQMTSQPVVAGSIQIPPDGVPIVLMAECQTIGGYPQIGHVISADLSTLARALPGTRIRFHEVGLDEARQAWRDLHRELMILETGLSLLP